MTSTSIRKENQKTIKALIQKNKRNAFFVRTMKLFLNRDEEYLKLEAESRGKRYESFYTRLRTMSSFTLTAGIILLVFAGDLMLSDNLGMGLALVVYSSILILSSYSFKKRANTALEILSDDFEPSNDFYLRRGKTEYNGKLVLDVIYLTLNILLLTVAEFLGNHAGNFALLMLVFGLSVRVSYSIGMIRGINNPRLLRNYGYSVVIETIRYSAIILIVGSLLLIIGSFLYGLIWGHTSPTPLSDNSVYYGIVMILFILYRKARRNLSIDTVDTGEFNGTFLQFIIFSDEKEIINEFGEEDLENQKKKSLWETFLSFAHIMLVSSSSIIAQELAKDFGYKRTVQPLLGENQNYIISFSIFILSMVFIFYVNKNKK